MSPESVGRRHLTPVTVFARSRAVYREVIATLPHPVPRFLRGRLHNRKALQPTLRDLAAGERLWKGSKEWMGFEPPHMVNPNFEWLDTAERSNPPGIRVCEPFYAMEANRTSVRGG